MFGVSVGIMDGAGGAAGGSFESIATATGTGSSNTITFSSIPSTYKHLQVRGFYRDTYTGLDASVALFVHFNGDTSNLYNAHRLQGDGSSASAVDDSRSGKFPIWFAGYTTQTYTQVGGVMIMDIHDYASTTKNKTVRTLSGVNDNTLGSNGVALQSGLYRSTNAINSITLTADLTAFATNTVYSLYGIKG
jgi:hypothetical protein